MACLGGDIDEELYSRQLYVLGHAAMRRMQSSNVLISGMKGLGVEIAKNVVLGGVKSVTIHDSGNATWNDLSAQFFLREADIGKNRADVTLPRLAELNRYVPCNCYTGDLTESYLKDFQVVILTNSSLEEQIKFGEFCHAEGIKFIIADTRGLVGMIFCDFGDEFTIHDIDGEESARILITDITKEGVVECWRDGEHCYEDGDHVQFSEVQGMTELNSHEPFKIKVLGPSKFSIGDVSGFTPYKRDGIVTKVKVPQTKHFKSFKEAKSDPEFVIINDDAKTDRPRQFHVAFQALHQYSRNKSELPRSRNEEDAGEFLRVFYEANASFGAAKCDNVNEDLVREFAYGARGELCPMASVIGGLAAQEVIKACTGKFDPVFQFLYFDALECLPQENRDEQLTEQTCSQICNKYDGQTAVLGQDFQDKLGRLKYFLVGAGAVGCELMKNWALMGVSCGDGGRIYVSDMSNIKKPDLNRHLLFRSSDIKKNKASTAASAVKAMNPSFEITAYKETVGKDTEHIFTPDFFDHLDGLVTAVDNEQTRLYMDSQGVYSLKPFIYTKTTGLKANVQVVLPYLSESYSTTQPNPRVSGPIGTLKTFPFTTAHTIEWTRHIFDDEFTRQIEITKSYLTDVTFMEKTSKERDQQAIETLTTVRKVLVDNKPTEFEDCVCYGRTLWQRYFYSQIQNLLSDFPPDQVTSKGEPFWSGMRRCPHPIRFDSNNSMHIDFVMSAANIQAGNYGIKPERDRAIIKSMVDRVTVPAPELKSETLASTSVLEGAALGKYYSDTIQKLKDQLPTPESLKGFVLHPVEFEKDDDSNFHMDFIVACSNLRAESYDIPTADRHKCKLVAGKISPSVITTASVAAGLACLEMIKVAQSHKDISQYKTSACNLALSQFNITSPDRAIINKYNDTEFTIWDRFEIQGELTLQEFLDYFQNKLRCKILMVAYGHILLYAFFSPKAKLRERLGLTMSEIVRLVTKKNIPSYVNVLNLDICCEDLQTEEDVEVPYIRYMLPDGYFKGR